jgi:hypothetical protein
MDDKVTVQSLVEEAIGKDPSIDQYVNEIETYFGIPAGTEVNLGPEAAALTETGDIEALGRFDRWKCIRCVAKNISTSVAIGAAIAAFGPASPGVVPFIAAKFGISHAVAGAAVGGVSGAALAKLLCGGVC